MILPWSLLLLVYSTVVEGEDVFTSLGNLKCFDVHVVLSHKSQGTSTSQH